MRLLVALAVALLFLPVPAAWADHAQPRVLRFQAQPESDWLAAVVPLEASDFERRDGRWCTGALLSTPDLPAEASAFLWLDLPNSSDLAPPFPFVVTGQGGASAIICVQTEDVPTWFRVFLLAAADRPGFEAAIQIFPGNHLRLRQPMAEGITLAPHLEGAGTRLSSAVLTPFWSEARGAEASFLAARSVGGLAFEPAWRPPSRTTRPLGPPCTRPAWPPAAPPASAHSRPPGASKARRTTARAGSCRRAGRSSWRTWA